jgi:hypothetical protein
LCADLRAVLLHLRSLCAVCFTTATVRRIVLCLLRLVVA